MLAPVLELDVCYTAALQDIDDLLLESLAMYRLVRNHALSDVVRELQLLIHCQDCAIVLWHLEQPIIDVILQRATLHEVEFEGADGLPCSTCMLVALRQRLVVLLAHLHERLELGQSRERSRRGTTARTRTGRSRSVLGVSKL